MGRANRKERIEDFPITFAKKPLSTRCTKPALFHYDKTMWMEATQG